MAAAARNSLHVDVVDERGRRQNVRGLAAWLRRVAPARARGAVTLVLVSDTRMRALNRVYRGKDYATDVLSFTAFAHPGGLERASRRCSVRSPQTQVECPSSSRGRGPAEALRPQPPAFARMASSRATARQALFLGDIVIALGVARRQAAEAAHSIAVELRVLALHGLLHLLGYDHERDNGRMRRVERRLRRKGGLREGLIERAAE
jgi:probable rRNA maturation factor